MPNQPELTPNADEDALAPLCAAAVNGDSAALASLMSALRDPIYGLALRMLMHPQDAEDATQEIAVRIMTRLSQYRGEGRFMAWAMRVAANYLINVHKKRRREQLTFADIGAELEQGWQGVQPLQINRAEMRLLVEEVKIGCSSAMLQCLDREKRFAYILGEVFEVTSEEGGEILEISAAAFRKRLSRAREALTGFMQQHCGLVEASNRCHCKARAPVAVKLGRVDPKHLFFANHNRASRPVKEQLSATTKAPDPNRVKQTVREMDAMHKAAQVFRSHPDYRGPETYMASIRALIESGRFKALNRNE